MTDILLTVPRIAVAVIVERGNSLLLGRRGKACGTGVGTWSVPGGALEFGELIVDAAARELLEESSMRMDTRGAEVQCSVENIFDNQHWVTMYVYGTCYGEPIVMEPDKCEEWRWFTHREIRSLQLFEPFKNYQRFMEGITLPSSLAWRMKHLT
jgi:8-oxo-dGTP diphosphatase